MFSYRYVIRQSQYVGKRLFTAQTARQGLAKENLNRKFSAEAAIATTPCQDSLVKDAIKKMLDQRDHVLDETRVIEDHELERRFRHFQVRSITENSRSNSFHAVLRAKVVSLDAVSKIYGRATVSHSPLAIHCCTQIEYIRRGRTLHKWSERSGKLWRGKPVCEWSRRDSRKFFIVVLFGRLCLHFCFA